MSALAKEVAATEALERKFVQQTESFKRKEATAAKLEEEIMSLERSIAELKARAHEECKSGDVAAKSGDEKTVALSEYKEMLRVVHEQYDSETKGFTKEIADAKAELENVASVYRDLEKVCLFASH